MFRSILRPGLHLSQASVAKSTSKGPLNSRIILPSVSILDSSQMTSPPKLQETTRLLHSFSKRPLHSCYDFSSALIPLYPSNATNPLQCPRIGIRFLNSDSKPPLTPSNISSKEEAPDRIKTSGSAKDLKDNPISGEQTAGKEGDNLAMKGLVDSVDTTIKRAREQINPGDLLSVWGIITLIGLIFVAPMAVRHMRRSDTDYDDLDPEDPVADLASFVRTEFLRDVSGGDSGKTSLGGLDTMVADLLRSPQIQDAINELVNKILISPQFKRSCSVLLKELWKDLVEDPETLIQVIHLLNNAILDETVKDAAVQLVTEVFADKEVLDEVVELFQRLGQEEKVHKATEHLLVESAHNALNDPEILDHSMEFATDVVGDDIVQQTAGEALYNTLSYAVRPTLSVFLGMLGTGLIVVSIMAFQNATSPESQSMDRALMTMEKSNIIQGLMQLIKLPWGVLVMCKEALMWLVLLPIRIVSGALTGMGRAGNTTVEALSRFIHWLVNLPVQLAQSLLSAIGNGLTVSSQTMATGCRNLARALSGSFLGELLHRMADLFGGATRALQEAWESANLTAANGAFAVESFLDCIVQKYVIVVATTSSGVMTTQAALRTVSISTHRGWVTTNRAVAEGAFRIEGWGRAWSKALLDIARKVQTKYVDLGLTKKYFVMRESISSSYKVADRSAESLGFFLEDIIARIIAH